jgi:hypothetical protein
MLVIITHEGAHALSAVALGFPSTLFNFWVDHQFTGATVVQRAIVGASGPVASLVLGVVAATAYRVVRRPAAGVPLLLIAAHGVTTSSATSCRQLSSATSRMSGAPGTSHGLARDGIPSGRAGAIPQRRSVTHHCEPVGVCFDLLIFTAQLT